MLISGSNEIIVSDELENAITIRDPKTGKIQMTLVGHHDEVNCLLVHEDTLISGSKDNTIKIWDLKTGLELMTLDGHKDEVKCLLVHGRKLISGSDDSTIKIWNLETGEKLQTFDKHFGGVTSLAISNGILISGSMDTMIKTWDLENEKELLTIDAHQALISGIVAYKDKFISSSWDRTIKIWDPKTGNNLKTFQLHRDKVIGIVAYDDMLITGSWDATLNICDIKDLKKCHILQKLELPGLVKNMTFCEGKLIAGLWETKTRIWDFNPPPCLSLYSKNILEKNLEILGQMAHAEYLQQPKAVEELAEKLDADFKQRLRQHSFKVGAPFTRSADVILRVQTEVCVEMLLVAIYDKDQKRTSQLLQQLIWLNPQNTKIYELLWTICNKPICDNWGEYAFHNQSGHSASFPQKEEAAAQFKQILKDRWGEDLPLLLADFGIVTKEEYLQKLKCTPDLLPKIGISSVADLQALGLFNSPDFHYLQMAPEKVIEGLDQLQIRNELQTRAFDKKTAVFSLLKALLDAAQQRSDEAEHEKFFTDNVWITLQEQLNAFQADLNVKCQTPQDLLETFTLESHTKIVEKMNAWINEFRKLDREHTIAKLAARIDLLKNKEG